ncbi:RNA-binding protein 5-A-like [Uloborus diversus]|uniref:RNA-binding protein 5-A-like n=1 Tax=Uloborus diversus TaxID=327109 RepID=UPI00240A4A25|nr:RNA-binding protein 5-A-like [Uloborus diversus]
MDAQFVEEMDDCSIPPPPGVDYDDHRRYDSRHDSSRSRSSRESDRDRDRSRHDRSKHDRDEDRRNSHESYRDLKDSPSDSSHIRSKEYDSRNKDHDYRSKDYDYRSKDYDSHSKDYDSRRRGYRDRSRDHDRDRVKDRSRDRDWDREKSRELDFRDDIPHSTILIKGMDPHVTEDDIRNEITRYSLYPKDIVVMRRKSTGESRGFAYVEFRMLSDAVRWKELTQGVLYFGSLKATLHYFVPKDLPCPERSLVIKVDWTCIKCGVNNFRKRDLCFKCNAPREEAELAGAAGEGCDEVSHSATSTLLFRNLDILTTEERVLSMLGQITVLPIKNLKVAKDSLTNTSRGFAYVELHSVSEAMQLYDLLVSMSGNFYVDGRRVTVTYSRRSLSSMNSAASANAASAALAAAQWTNQDAPSNSSGKMFSNSVIRERQMESVPDFNASFSNNNYQKYAEPDVTAYQYDETSGYYYDSTTGFYYDPNSRYYYNSATRQYLYWDAEKQTYMFVPASDSTTSEESQATAEVGKAAEVVISSPPVIAHAPVLTVKKNPEKEKAKEKVNAQDKVKIAKRVAKDMEKWAKTLNQKKENAKASIQSQVLQKQVQQPVFEAPATSYAESNATMLEKKKFDMTSTEVVKALQEENAFNFSGQAKEKSGLVAAYGGESDSEVESESQDDGTRALDLIKAEESKLIDWTKLACLLCKRQFPSKEVLTKHTQFSDLHKQNVDMLRLTKLTPKQLQDLEQKEFGYRDRAKERRQKFGQPDMPPPSRLKTKYLKDRKESYVPPSEPVEAIGSDNIGNKMLKAMGWTEGQGLGKSGQGMSGIIEVQRRVKSAGLGMKGASYGATASESYKDAVRKAMQARYNEIA